MNFPGITRKGMINIDRIMIKELQIPVELMMEHAGINLAKLLIKQNRKYNKDEFLIVAGKGNNGAGGIVAARRLKNWGYDVKIYLPGKTLNRSIPKKQLQRAKNIDVEIIYDSPKDEYLVCDSYIGYNFQGKLRSDAKEIISFMSNYPTVSLDIPTGIRATSGINVSGIEVEAILTLAWPKSGLLKSDPQSIGEVYLADIGIPIRLFGNDDLFYPLDAPSERDLRYLANKFALKSFFEINITSSKWEIL